MSVLVNVVVQLFSESNPQNQDTTKGKPLGLLAESMVMNITSIESDHMMTFLENPLLHSYGSIEQTFLDLLRHAREIDTIHKGEWPLFLRAMTIPLSDDLFIDRQEATEAMAVSKVALTLIKDLKMWNEYPQFFAPAEEESKESPVV
jgi:hypothetical protein